LVRAAAIRGSVGVGRLVGEEVAGERIVLGCV
jgi:hypothetical protein